MSATNPQGITERLQQVAFYATAFEYDAGRVDLMTVVHRLRRDAHKARPPFDDMRRQLADDVEAGRV